MIIIIHNNKIIQCATVEEARGILELMDEQPLLDSEKRLHEARVAEMASTPFPVHTYLEQKIRDTMREEKPHFDRKNKRWERAEVEFFLEHLTMRPRELSEKLNRPSTSISCIKYGIFHKRELLPTIFREILEEKKNKIILNKQ